MNSFVLNTIGRYVLNSIGGAVLSHGLMTGATWQTVSGAILAAVVAGVGALSSTDNAAVKRVNGVPGIVAVPADPTLTDPNAR